MRFRNLQLIALAILVGVVMLVSRPSLGETPARAAAFAATGTEKRSALEQEILKQNDRMLDAEVRADIPALEQFFTDDFVRMTLGGFENKTNFLNALKTGRNRFLAYDLSDVQIHAYGTVAVIAGGLHLKSAAGDTQNLFADVWVQQKGQWQTAAWVTNRPAPAGRVMPGDSPVKKTDTAGLGTLEQSLLKRNEDMFRAHTRGDAALDQFLTGDFLRLTVDGIRNKTGFLNDLKAGKTRFEIFEPNDVKVRVYGPSAVLLGGCRMKDAASDTQNSFLDVWVQQKGKWRTAAWIADPHPPPQAAPAASR